MSEKYRVVTNGHVAGHHFDKGDVVELQRRNFPAAGLNTYQRDDGLVQALDVLDVEAVDE